MHGRASGTGVAPHAAHAGGNIDGYAIAGACGWAALISGRPNTKVKFANNRRRDEAGIAKLDQRDADVFAELSGSSVTKPAQSRIGL